MDANESAPKDSVDEHLDSYFKFPFHSMSTSHNLQIPPLPIPPRDELYYPTSRSKRGCCIILNNEQFPSDTERRGSQLDVDKLKYTFTRLGFVVEDHLNLSKKSTRELVKRVASSDHSQYDCFAMCILSHGNEGDEISTTDGSLRLEQDFISHFTPNSCPTLTGKPKLFFIQACRGDDVEEGTLVTDSIDRADATSSSHSQARPFQLPNHADFFIFYSCYVGKTSVRNPISGSWFIQNLCRVLNSFKNDLDMLTMATLVCKRVAFNHETYIPSEPWCHQKKQMPCFLSTLTRVLKFKAIQG